MTVDQLREIPCGTRGFHWLKYATVPPGYPRHAPVDVECSQCGVAFLHRRDKPRSERARGPRLPVPPSPPAGRRDDVQRVEADLWLDAAGFLGSGGAATFDAMTAASNVDAWRSPFLLRDLAALGHLDIEEANARPSRWSVSPPAASFIDEAEAVLAGFRSRSLLADIEEATVSAGGTVDIARRPDQPAVVTIRGLAPAALETALGRVRDPHGRRVEVVEHASRSLAAFASTSTGQLFGPFQPATLGWDGDVQQFEPRSGRWRRVDRPSSAGAYRLSRGGTWYFLRTAGGSTYTGPHALVKLAAARAAGVALHAYDGQSRSFVSRLGCEPPGLLARALVSCSGELPAVDRRLSSYRRVSPDVAALVLAILYDGDLPS